MGGTTCPSCEFSTANEPECPNLMGETSVASIGTTSSLVSETAFSSLFTGMLGEPREASFSIIFAPIVAEETGNCWLCGLRCKVAEERGGLDGGAVEILPIGGKAIRPRSFSTGSALRTRVLLFPYGEFARDDFSEIDGTSLTLDDIGHEFP
jgi:hypothetical protein